MSVIVVQRKRKMEYFVPPNGEIYWFGTASQLPADWEIDTYAFDTFVLGTNTGQASNTKAGANSHKHTFSLKTGSVPNHTHGASSGSLGGTSNNVDFYPYGDYAVAGGGHGHSGDSGATGPSGGHDHTMNDTATTPVYPPYNRLYLIRATAIAACPVGGIIMWNDNAADLPDGFAVCDGTNNTPDLRDQFIYIVNSDANLGSRGGTATHTHGNQNTQAAGGHRHDGTLHSGNAPTATDGSGSQGVEVSTSHNHAITFMTNSDSDHAHTIENTNAASSLPPYIRLYFAMRIQ